MTSTRTVVFWGAGATASLGIRTTDQQSEFIGNLASIGACQPLRKRVEQALEPVRSKRWIDAFSDLLDILGDGEEGQQAANISEQALKAMKRNWTDDGSAALRDRIREMRSLYDWKALTAAVRACPGSRNPETQNRFKLNDLINILDLHGQSGHGFHVEEGFLTPQRVNGAKNALKMLLQAMFYVDWQSCVRENRNQLDLYYDFAAALGRRMQHQGVLLAHERHEDRKFYLGDVSFASMNYDPIGLWCQYVANRNLNNNPAVPHIGSPASPLQLFHDQAHFIPGARVGKRGPQIWHPMNESSVQRLNEIGHSIRITKFLLPHGCICWRECPNCGKLSAYMGHLWRVDSHTLIPPPPLRAFVKEAIDEDARTDEERKKWRDGAVDAHECVHCKTMTYTYHISTLMQSNLKDRPPSFIEEIQRDLRVVVRDATHVVLMGYSLPPDDVIYRAFFASHTKEDDTVQCSVVGKQSGHEGWVGPTRLDGITELRDHPAVGAARDLFGPKNVRFYGGGVPNVFLDGGTVTAGALERLLVWSRH